MTVGILLHYMLLGGLYLVPPFLWYHFRRLYNGGNREPFLKSLETSWGKLPGILRGAGVETDFSKISFPLFVFLALLMATGSLMDGLARGIGNSVAPDFALLINAASTFDPVENPGFSERWRILKDLESDLVTAELQVVLFQRQVSAHFFLTSAVNGSIVIGWMLLIWLKSLRDRRPSPLTQGVACWWLFWVAIAIASSISGLGMTEAWQQAVLDVLEKKSIG